MAATVDAVIAALEVALNEAEQSEESHLKVAASNRWVALLPGAEDGKWKQLLLDGDDDGEVSQADFVAHVRATLAFLETDRDAMIHVPTSVAQIGARPEALRAQAEAVQPSATRILRPPRDREHFLSGFLAIIGVQPEHFSDLSGEAFSAAVAAADSFSALRQRHAILNRYLEIRERDNRELFEKALEDFEQSIADQNSSEWKEVDFAYQDLSQNWPVVVLLPNGPFEDLMQRIVLELGPEGAAGNLSADDAEVLAVARKILEYGKCLAKMVRRLTVSLCLRQPVPQAMMYVELLYQTTTLVLAVIVELLPR